jgi:transposase-like protein
MEQTYRVNGRLPEPAVTGKATRRKFSAEYKLRILAEAEASTVRGQIGALLRREGLYASTLDKWRQQRVRGTLGGEKRGPKVDAQAAELRRLQRENERLQQQLRRAENIIEIQKKLAVLLGAELQAGDEVEQPAATGPKRKPRRSD